MTKSKILIAFAVVALVGAGSAFAANTLAVNATAALGGTSFGLDLFAETNNATTNSVYVQSDHPNSETHMTLRWRMSVAALLAPISGGGRTMRFLEMIDADDSALPHKIFFIQRQTTTGNWRFLAWGRNTTTNSYDYLGGFFLAAYASTADLQVECDSTMAPGVANGILTCTKVGTAQTFNNTTVSDAGRQTDSVVFGFFDFDNFGNNTSGGHLYLDEYESYR